MATQSLCVGRALRTPTVSSAPSDFRKRTGSRRIFIGHPYGKNTMSTTENAVPQGLEISSAALAIQDLGVPAPLSGNLQRVQDDSGVASAIYLSTSKLQAGSLAEPAAFQVQVPFNDPSGPSFVIGDTSRSNLRMGVDPKYSWIQSHGNFPLQVNPVGNPVLIGASSTASVGIGTASPQANLDVNGSVRATSLSVTGALSVGSLTVAGDSLKITGIPSATTAPTGGSTLKVLFVDPATGSLYAL
jgi:hypothetical protein